MSSNGPRPSDDELALLRADLDRAGRVRREVLGEALAMPPEPAEQRLVAASPHRKAPAQRSRRALVLALAAASVLVLALIARLATTGSAPSVRETHEVLGEELELIEPVGKAASFGTFRWRPVPRASSYVVVVSGSDDGVEVDRSPEVEDTQWQPPSERWTRWPRNITWEVRAFDAAGRPGRSVSARASLSP